MDAQTIDIGLGESQIFSFSSDLIAGNELPVIIDQANVNAVSAVSEGNILLDENGIAYLSIPIQIVQDAPHQSTDLLQEVKSNVSSVAPVMYIDSSQLALLNNQELVITNPSGSSLNKHVSLNSQLEILGADAHDKQTLINIPGLVDGSVDISSIDLSSICINPSVAFNIVLPKQNTQEVSNESGNISLENVNSSSLNESSNTEKRTISNVDDLVDPPIRRGPPFKCEVCGQEFVILHAFRSHQRSHKFEKPFKCKSCTASFNHASNLLLHEVLHSTDSELRCPECKKKFNRLASLKAHLLMHEKEENLCCTECGDEFHNQIELDEHLMVHEEEWLQPKVKEYSCKQCSRSFKSASILRDHMKEHYTLKRIVSSKKYKRGNVKKKKGQNQCDICQKQFQKPSQLLRHKRIHTGERPYKCNLCSRAFNQKGSLKIHMLKHNGKKPYKCLFCEASFSQKGNLRCHVLRLHSIPNSGEVVYECHECPCVFRKIGSLNAHANRAHGTKDANGGVKKSEKNGASVSEIDLSQPDGNGNNEDGPEEGAADNGVTILQHRTETNNSTQIHKVAQRRVGSVKWHMCPYCRKEFKKPSDLIRHIRTHTNEKPFKCFHCDRAFAVRSTLSSHLRTHSGAKNYVCSLCNRAYANSRSLKLHKSTFHYAPIDWGKVDTTAGSSEKVPEKNRKNPRVFHVTIKCDDTPNAISNNVVSSSEKPLLVTEHGFLKQMTPVVKESMSDTQRPYVCGVCNFRFRKTSHLQTHMRKHTGERPYQCSVCKKSFVTNGILRTHLKSHLGIKSHSCNDCGKLFSTRGSLRRHSAIHSEHDKFACPYCQKTYKCIASCKKHMQTHEANKGNLPKQFEKEIEIRVLDDKPEDSANGEPANFEDVVCSFPEGLASEDVGFNEVVGPFTILQEPPEKITEEIVYSETMKEDGHNLLNNSDGTRIVGETYTQESIQEMEDTFSQQLFGGTVSAVTLDKDQGTCQTVINFDRSFENCVFSSIEIPSDELVSGLNQVIVTSTDSGVTSVVMPQNVKIINAFRCEECNSCFNSNVELESHKIMHSHNTVTVASIMPVTSVASIVTSADSLVVPTLTEAKPKSSGLRSKSGRKQKNPSSNRKKVTTKGETPDEAVMSVEETKETTIDFLFECPVCHVQFSSGAAFQTHLETATDEQHTIVLTQDALNLQTVVNAGSLSQKKSRWKRGAARVLTETERTELSKVQPETVSSVSEKVLISLIAEKDRVNDMKDPLEVYEKEPMHQHQCKYCPKSFRKPSDLIRHLRIHTGERPFQCQICFKCFTVKSTLECHLKTHNIGKKHFSCHVCGYSFATKGSLKVHMRLHTGAMPFRCPICSQRFRTSGHRKTHLLLHMKNEKKEMLNLNENLLSGTPIQTISSDQDAVSTVISSEPDIPEVSSDNIVSSSTVIMSKDSFVMKPGILDSDAEKNNGDDVSVLVFHTCRECGKSFKKKSQLTRHVRIHTGERPFQCTECPKAFNQKNALVMHMKRHNGEKPWECTECGASFTQKGNLQTHIRRNHKLTQESKGIPKKEIFVEIEEPKSPMPVTITLDLSDKNLDLDKVVNDLFPQMKHSMNSAQSLN